MLDGMHADMPRVCNPVFEARAHVIIQDSKVSTRQAASWPQFLVFRTKERNSIPKL